MINPQRLLFSTFEELYRPEALLVSTKQCRLAQHTLTIITSSRRKSKELHGFRSIQQLDPEFHQCIKHAGFWVYSAAGSQSSRDCFCTPYCVGRNPSIYIQLFTFIVKETGVGAHRAKASFHH